LRLKIVSQRRNKDFFAFYWWLFGGGGRHGSRFNREVGSSIGREKRLMSLGCSPFSFLATSRTSSTHLAHKHRAYSPFMIFFLFVFSSRLIPRKDWVVCRFRSCDAQSRRGANGPGDGVQDDGRRALPCHRHASSGPWKLARRCSRAQCRLGRWPECRKPGR